MINKFISGLFWISSILYFTVGINIPLNLAPDFLQGFVSTTNLITLAYASIVISLGLWQASRRKQVLWNNGLTILSGAVCLLFVPAMYHYLVSDSLYITPALCASGGLLLIIALLQLQLSQKAIFTYLALVSCGAVIATCTGMFLPYQGYTVATALNSLLQVLPYHGTFASSDLLAIFAVLSFALGMGICHHYEQENWFLKVLISVFLFAIACFAIYKNQSTLAVSLLSTIVVLFVISFTCAFKTYKTATILSLLMLIGVLALATTFKPADPLSANVYEAVLAIFKEHWAFGTGYATYDRQILEQATALQDANIFIVATTNLNIFWMAVVEAGIFGIAGVVGLVLFVLMLLRQAPCHLLPIFGALLLPCLILPIRHMPFYDSFVMEIIVALFCWYALQYSTKNYVIDIKKLPTMPKIIGSTVLVGTFAYVGTALYSLPQIKTEYENFATKHEFHYDKILNKFVDFQKLNRYQALTTIYKANYANIQLITYEAVANANLLTRYDTDYTLLATLADEYQKLSIPKLLQNFPEIATEQATCDKLAKTLQTVDPEHNKYQPFTIKSLSKEEYLKIKQQRAQKKN